MTRPKKEETLAKTKDVHLRMNETEYDLLAERAKANRMTVSDFVRSALDNQKVIIKYEITADVPEIKKLISEFGKIGSNLNQIARALNIIKNADPQEQRKLDIFSIFSVLKGIQTDLEQVFPALPKISRQSPERLKKQLSSVQLAEEDESAY
jgi:uncharacterized protein (DUF1778 family)